MKDSQRVSRRFLRRVKYIKVNNERFSTFGCGDVGAL